MWPKNISHKGWERLVHKGQPGELLLTFSWWGGHFQCTTLERPVQEHSLCE
jgi:hypothetical protein